MTNCVSQRKPLCLSVNAASKTAPRIFHQENVAACVNKTTSVYAKSTISPADLDDLADTCAYVFQGNSAMACAVKYDCADKNKICDKGQCAAKAVVAKGMGCANAGQVCAVGSYCAVDPSSTSTLPSCLTKAAQSAACSATVPCLEAFRCDGATQTCLPPVMAGEACTANTDCPTAAPYCDPAIGNKCDLGLSFAAGAATCAAYGGGATGTGGSSGGGSGGSTGTNDASSG
jgi:hypothetical protein